MKDNAQEFEQALRTLYACLEEELERQENMVAVCAAQAEAAVARDIEALEARTSALHVLIEDAARAQSRRLAATATLVETLGLPVEQQTLSSLIAAVPSPWRERYQEVQSRIQSVLAQSTAHVRRNNRVFRTGLRSANAALHTLGVESEAGYEEPSRRTVKGPVAPSLIDRAG